MPVSQPAWADEIIFRNGDHITGKIISLADGKLVLTSDGAGKLTVDVKKLKTFSSNDPLTITLGAGAPFDSRVGAAPDGKVEIRRSPNAAPELVAILDIAAINPRARAWSGEVSLYGKVTGGQSKTSQVGVDFTFDKERKSDRLHLTGEYTYGRERSLETGVTSTTDDFGDIFGKYSRDIDRKAYVHLNAKVLHDALANLRYRASPATGFGYRWFDAPSLKLFTDLAVSHTDERFTTSGGRSFWGPQLAYGVEWRPVNRLRLSNTLEYYPSLADFSGNYLLDTQAAVHFSLTSKLFVKVRAEYHYDTAPAPGTRKAQYRFLIGPGWGS